MTVEQYFKEYLINKQNYKKYWDFEYGCMLVGCQRLYEATQDTFYKEFVSGSVNFYLDPNGMILEHESNQKNLNGIQTSKTLFFLNQQMQDERYINAIESSMKQLTKLARTKSGNFESDEDYKNVITLESMYIVQPFYMAYETIFNKKENYYDILKQFENVREYIVDDNIGLCYPSYNEAIDQPVGHANLESTGYLLMALIDTIDVMSIEIFEIYKALKRMFKDTLKATLKCFDNNLLCFSQKYEKKEEENNYTETKLNAMIVYSMLKACRLGVLSKEKYKKCIEEILANLFTDEFVLKEDAKENDNCHKNDRVLYYSSKQEKAELDQVVNALMFAYAESLMMD